MAAPRKSTSARPPPPPPGSEAWQRPWVQLRSAAFHPFIYRRMVGAASEDAAAGDVVAVYDRKGERFGSGFYNPRSAIALRMLAFDGRPVDDAFFRGLLDRAVALRHEVLRLPEATDAYRVVHAEGDGLSGLVADRFDDVLSVEVFSQGVYRFLGSWLPLLDEFLGTTRRRVRIDPRVAELEGFRPPAGLFENDPRPARIREHGVRYEIDFSTGHKTGFFCDQRENRLRFADLVRERTVLDLCCYTGGFALTAAVVGGAADVTGVDLDEDAVSRARRNANLNQKRARWVHSDAFIYARQMQANGRQWDALVLDPPKFIAGRGEIDEGRRKYHDLNRLALALVKEGGLMVTCSCSGLLWESEFERLVVEAARRAGRRLQILDRTGAGADHPVLDNCPESRYLTVLWARVL